MSWSHGKTWTDASIEEELRRRAGELRRMPSANELRASGANDLACAISRRGGFSGWAEKMGLKQKSSDTHRGQKWERHEADFFRSLGYLVEEQTAKAPFDLLVNGLRVDVKSSKLTRHGFYQYGGIRNGEGCDLFDLLCIDGGVKARVLVPSSKANVAKICMMPATLDGLGKYGAFVGAVHLLNSVQVAR